jgi:hypothetical protein
MVKCRRCQDARWVCENHPDKPWNPEHEKSCSGAGNAVPGLQRAAPG